LLLEIKLHNKCSLPQIAHQSKKFIPIREEISKNEKNVLNDGANHHKGMEAMGGWLFLTNTT